MLQNQKVLTYKCTKGTTPNNLCLKYNSTFYLKYDLLKIKEKPT